MAEIINLSMLMANMTRQQITLGKEIAAEAAENLVDDVASGEGSQHKDEVSEDEAEEFTMDLVDWLQMNRLTRLKRNQAELGNMNAEPVTTEPNADAAADQRDEENQVHDGVKVAAAPFAGEEIATAIEIVAAAQIEAGEADTQVKVAADENRGEGEGAAAKDEPKVMNADATLSDDEFFDAADSVEEELALAEERSSP